MNNQVQSKFITRLQKIIEVAKNNSFITATELAKLSGISRMRINDYLAWLKFYDIVEVRKVGKMKLVTVKEGYEEKLAKLTEELGKKGVLDILV